MGAAESTSRPITQDPQSPPAASPPSSSPAPKLQVDHPLHILLHATVAPPTDLDSQFYITLFQDFLTIARKTPQPLSPLITSALSEPSSHHAVALSTALRAAVYHLRLESALTQLGALHFAGELLSDLRRLADKPLDASLALAAGPVEIQLHLLDRVDLATARRTQLMHAVLALLAKPDNCPYSAQFTAVAVPLLLLLFPHQHVNHDPSRHPPIKPSTTAGITPDLTTCDQEHASRIVTTLLDIVVHAAPYTSPISQLSFGVNTPAPIRTPISVDHPSVWDAWDSLATSAPALQIRNGLADVFSALTVVSQRLNVAKWPDTHALPRERALDPSTSTNATTSETSMVDELTSAPLSDTILNTTQTPTGVHHLHTVRSADRSSLEVFTTSRLVLAKQALVLLDILCRPDNPANQFVKTLCNLQDTACTPTSDNPVYSFSALYEALGRWMADPKAALLGYYLFVRNRGFRTFALARTDPDVIVMPILASLRARCVVGAVPADAFVAACMLLALTSDQGFCEAINSIPVPSAWAPCILDRVRLAGESLMLSGAVLLVCARVVQQSLVARRESAVCFLSGVCLGVMANVAKDTTNLHSFVAERVVSLVEFLGRRRKKAAATLSQQSCEPVKPPRLGDAVMTSCNGLETDLKAGAVSGEKGLVDRLSRFIGIALEVVIALLRAGSTVSANRHLVYVLMHRDGVLDGEHIAGCCVKARTLVHMIGRMVHFFSDFVDRKDKRLGNGRARRDHGNGISVERVFQVIEESSRVLPADIFDGLPTPTFSFRDAETSDRFLTTYALTLLTRFWIGDEYVEQSRERDGVLLLLANEHPSIINTFTTSR